MNHLLRLLSLDHTQHPFVRNDVDSLVWKLHLTQTVCDSFLRLLYDPFACRSVQAIPALRIFLTLLIPQIPHRVPDSLVSFRPHNVRRNTELLTIHKDGDVRDRETIVEEDDDAIESVKALTRKISRVRRAERACARYVIPDERTVWIRVWVSRYLSRGLGDPSSGSPRIPVPKPTDSVYEGRFSTASDASDGEMEEMFVVLDALLCNSDFFGGEQTAASLADLTASSAF